MSDDRGAVETAEQILLLLDRGQFVATYKYAVLLGLMDLCLERASRDGSAPQSVTTRQLAERVIELYWPHTIPFVASGQARKSDSERILRQNKGGPAEILTLICEFRRQHAPAAASALSPARAAAGEAFKRLVRNVEWKLIEMPLPKLQRLSTGESAELIYRINWDDHVKRRDTKRDDFDNQIRFVGNAGEHLVRLAGLLRPLIQREWASMVADLNRDLTGEQHLADFLFGRTRVSLEAVRDPLREIQGDRCFYCGERLGARVEVDHFVPWARYPNDDLQNLVVADSRCNNDKRDFLAAVPHVRNWADRNLRRSADLHEIARLTAWRSDDGRSSTVARAVYFHMPERSHLWLGGRTCFEALERTALRTVLEAAPSQE